jgi:uncharacterized protein (TIGR02268 family)
MGTLAAAQRLPQFPVRERKERQLVLTGSAREPVPEVRVAVGFTTYLRFDAPIERASVEVAGWPVLFQFMDVGERVIALEPLLELESWEQLSVRVRYQDGAFPQRVQFSLVSHSTVVDGEVKVGRRLPVPEAQDAEPEVPRARCEANGLVELALSGRLEALEVVPMAHPSGNLGGQIALDGLAYRTRTWALVTVRVRNAEGQKPWSTVEARLTQRGSGVTVHSVRMDRQSIAPGETGMVVLLLEEPSLLTDGMLHLELLEHGGSRHLSAGQLKL